MKMGPLGISLVRFQWNLFSMHRYVFKPTADDVKTLGVETAINKYTEYLCVNVISESLEAESRITACLYTCLSLGYNISVQNHYAWHAQSYQWVYGGCSNSGG